MTPKLGIYVNNRAAVFMREDYSLSTLLEAARLAEASGFEFVSVGDSPLAKPRYTPIPVLSAIAAQTSTIRLSTGVLQPHMRHPVLLAQDWATLDEISNGRTWFTVGLGTGPPDLVEHEYHVLGIPKKRRGVAFDEAIESIKRLWTEETVTFTGSIFSFEDVTLGYTTAQQPHPPIIIACGGYIPTQAGTGPNDFFSEDKAGTFHGPFDRVARLGDGWITGIITPEEYSTTLALIRSIAEQRYGRTLDASFRTILNCFIHVADDAETARREGIAFLEQYHRRPFDDETVRRWLIYGSPEECAQRIQTFAEAGVQSFQLVPASRQPLHQIEQIASRVMPLLQDTVQTRVS